MNTHKLDCKGQRCPKPIIQISRRMRELETGDTLEVEADDPAFRPDLDAWLSTQASELLEARQMAGSEWVLLRRTAA